MEYFKIESGIQDTGKTRVAEIAPILRKMTVGDSFALPDKTRLSVCNAVAKIKKELGWKFTVRKQEDGHYRCFRIE